ncbi:MAG: DNA translocase FtsK [Desulfurivibrionaceae bacterium]
MSGKDKSPTIRQEVTGIISFAAGLFLLFCLVSFNMSSAPQVSADNLGGAVGSFLSTLLFNFMGISSFWAPILLFILSFTAFFSVASVQRFPFVIAGVTGLLLSSSALFGAFDSSTLYLLGKNYPLGGYLGNFLFGLSSAYLGGAGAILIFSALFLLSVMAVLNFSLYQWGKRLFNFCRILFIKIKKAILLVSLLKPANRQGKMSGNPLGKQVDITEKGKKGGKAEQAAEAPVLQPPAVPQVNEPARILTEPEEKEFQPVQIAGGMYRLPGLQILDKPEKNEQKVDREQYLQVSNKLEETLNSFGVKGNVTGISPGPVVTTYEFAPAPGVKISKVVNLADDVALKLKTASVRIVGSIPGKAALGIEVANPDREVVHIRDILATEDYQKSKSRLTMALGMDVVGNPVTADLGKMPHLLIAGATGAGKSVAINTIICSILFKATPDEVRLLLIDPKRIELSGYEDIPHLLHPVVADPKMASRALQWAVKEMERRYSLLEEMKVKSFTNYNRVAEEKLPYIVIIIDELADLMMVSSSEVETSVARLAQKARAAGVHLILATQRPSVDVLTGLIKANFPTRMSFKVSSKVDSRTILDGSGAEHLLGAGDMLFLPPGAARLQRIHGAFISEKESERIVDFLKEQGIAQYDETVIKSVEENGAAEGEAGEEDYDEKYDEAVEIVCDTGQASISMIQRRLRIGYNRAARIIETMEREGVIGPADGAKPREVLVRKEY